MTNKEAKEKLYMEWQKFLEDNIDYAGVSEAYKMAFKALDQEPCEDAISRQEVLYLIADYDLSMGQVVRGIHALPSVTPIRPKGHWISHREHCENLGVMPSGLGDYEWCSNCDCGIDVREWHMNNYNYCPNCGSRNEVEE